MGLLSWTRTRFRRRFRTQYNSGNYGRSLRNGRISFRIFNDRIGLDVAARSSLRLKKYDLAASLYRTASNRGWKLRDMDINHFEAELKSGNLVEAFKLAPSLASLEPERKPFSSIARQIRGKNQRKRFELIRSMNLHDNIPQEFVDLVPEKLDKVPEKRTNSQNIRFWKIRKLT